MLIVVERPLSVVSAADVFCFDAPLEGTTIWPLGDGPIVSRMSSLDRGSASNVIGAAQARDSLDYRYLFDVLEHMADVDMTVEARVRVFVRGG